MKAFHSDHFVLPQPAGHRFPSAKYGVCCGSASPASCHRVALHEGVAANLAGGTHHAYANRGSGFCVFNDAAVAARLMQVEKGRQQRQPLQMATIDLDVHQGHGTAHIFRQDVALPDGCGDEPYLQALEGALDELQHYFAPGLVIYLAGADPFEGDRLGQP